MRLIHCGMSRFQDIRRFRQFSMLGDCASTKVPSYTGNFTVDYNGGDDTAEKDADGQYLNPYLTTFTIDSCSGVFTH
ncbi:hypothetical protein T484DRAFT_1899244 [Baffinella frigidus]|nr:hypothetical protein T484DRAFT_1899244 [Cryptophyta sp. CCMP2293]